MDEALDNAPAAIPPLEADKGVVSLDTTKSSPPVTGTFKDNPPFINDEGIPIPAEGSNQDNTDPPTKSRFQNIIEGVLPDIASSGQTGAFEPAVKFAESRNNESPAVVTPDQNIFIAQEYPVGQIVKIGDENFIRVREIGNNGKPQLLWRQVLKKGYGESPYSDNQIQAMFESPPAQEPESAKSKKLKDGIINSPFTQKALNGGLNPAIIGGYPADQGRQINKEGIKNDERERNVMASSSIAGATPPKEYDPDTRKQLYHP